MAFPDQPLDLGVEMMFGDAATPPDQWVWTDVSDRLLQQNMTLNRGRANESSQTQPSTVSFTLDNLDGALTPGKPSSPYYPHLHVGTPVRISAGGGRNALVLTGATGSVAATPDSAALDITGDIDIRARIHPDRWTALGDYQTIAAKRRGGQVSWEFGLVDGQLMFAWSADGTVILYAFTDPAVAALRPAWVAATFDVNDGAGGSLISWWRWDGDEPPDSIADWVPVDTHAYAATSIFAGTAPVEIGALNGGTASFFRGQVLALQIRDGVDGTVVADVDFTTQPVGSTSIAGGAGETWALTGDASISTRTTRFVGTVDSIKLEWPFGDHHAHTTEPSESRASFTVAGILRRLSQGEKALQSSLRRHVTAEAHTDRILGYWPAEDGDRAVQLSSALAANPSPMSISDTYEPGSDDSFPASAPLPTLPAGEIGVWSATPLAGGADAWTVEMLFRLPAMTTSPTRTQLLEVQAEGDAARFVVDISSSNLRLRVLDPGIGTLIDTTWGIADYSDRWVMLRLEAKQNGANIDVDWGLIDIDEGTGGGTPSSAAGTLGRVVTVGGNTLAPAEGMTIGHIIVHDGVLGLGWLAGADTAWVGESAGHRFDRLCREEGIEAEVIGGVLPYTLRGDLSLSEPMGPQVRAPFLALLNECVELESGVMMERRRAPGLVFRPRRSLEAQPVRLPLDAQQPGEVNNPFEPVEDDQRLRNLITVASRGGSSATALDQTSIDTRGEYRSDTTIAGVGGVKIQTGILGAQTGLTEWVAGQNLHQAQRRLALLSSSDMRYPSVTLDLAGATNRIADFAELELGDRVTVSNLPSQHPNATVELLVEHITEELGPKRWRPTLACSPGAHWLSPWPDISVAVGPLDVSAVNSSSGTVLQTVTNPVQGTGNTIIAIATASGPSNEPDGSWVAPPGGTQIFDYGGSAFVSRCRAWRLVDDGSASYQFGWDPGSGNIGVSVLIGLDGVAGDIVVTPTPVVLGGSTSTPYPSLGTQVGDLVGAVGVSQTTDIMTAGPAGYTEELNLTSTVDRNAPAVHTTRATESTTTPGNSTWNGSVGGHVQWVFAVRGSTAGGPTAARIDTAKLVIDFDATNSATWGKASAAQKIIGGDRFNQNLDGNIHGLVWEADGKTINSFAMQDSQGTARLKEDTFGGITIVNGATQFVDDGSYTYQSGAVNTAINSPPSDELFYDGSRVTWSWLSNQMSVGPSATPIICGVSFVVEQWMLANDYTTGPFELHDSTIYRSAPLLMSIRNGQISLGGKYSATPIDPTSTSNIPTSWSAGSHTLPAVGQWFTTIVEFKVDPGGTGFANWWRLDPSTGLLVLIGQQGPDFGFIYDTTHPSYAGENDEFYPIGPVLYQFHQYSPPGISNNWDLASAGSNVRRLRVAQLALSQDPTVSPTDMAGHAKFFLGLT